MDFIYGSCPECETKLRSPQDAIFIRCPTCKNEFQVSNPINKTQLYFIGKRIFFIGVLVFLSYFVLIPIVSIAMSDRLVFLYLIPIPLLGSIVALVGLTLMAYDKFSNGDRMVVRELIVIGFILVSIFGFYQTVSGFNGIV